MEIDQQELVLASGFLDGLAVGLRHELRPSLLSVLTQEKTKQNTFFSGVAQVEVHQRER